MTWAAAWRLSRPVRAPALVVVVYLVLAEIFSTLAGLDGFVAPGGSLRVGVAVLGVVVVLLRLVLLFVVPATLAYQLVRWALGRQAASPDA